MTKERIDLSSLYVLIQVTIYVNTVKLYNPVARLNIRRHYFNYWMIKSYCSLALHDVDALSANTFKDGLDQHWFKIWTRLKNIISTRHHLQRRVGPGRVSRFIQKCFGILILAPICIHQLIHCISNHSLHFCLCLCVKPAVQTCKFVFICCSFDWQSTDPTPK